MASSAENTPAVTRYCNEISAEKKDRTECGNYRDISVVVPAGKILLKMVATRLGIYCEAKRLLLKEQCGFHLPRSTTDMMFAVRKLQELGRKAQGPPSPCFIYLI